MPTYSLTGTTISARDPGRLAAFYQRLLGWSVAIAEPGWVMLSAPYGPGLNFHGEDLFETPTWPSVRGQQQVTMQLEFEVDNLDDAVRHAEQAGAIRCGFQPQLFSVVMIDPEGHPFTLFEG